MGKEAFKEAFRSSGSPGGPGTFLGSTFVVADQIRGGLGRRVSGFSVYRAFRV